MSVLVAIPVLNRPERAAVVADSIRASETIPTRIVFLVSPGDDAEEAACRATGEETIVVGWAPGRGDYARKINLAAAIAVEDWIFTGADDLRFTRGWDERAVKVGDKSGAHVIGTDDRCNRRTKQGQHSTHSLVRRAYADTLTGTIDQSGSVYHPGYWHNFCNPEHAPIWMSDCSFKDLGDVRPGDKVIGWQHVAYQPGDSRTGVPRRFLCEATVLATSARPASLVRVTMESGRQFSCTPDHLWLNGHAAPSSKSPQFVQPAVGKTLVHVVDQPAPLPPGTERLAGWVAGIYDGEGSGIYVATQSANHNPVLTAAIRDALVELRVPHSFTVRRSGVAEFVLTGGRQGYLDFLLRFNPVRRDVLAAHITGWRTRESSRRDRAQFGARRFGKRDRIVAVEKVKGRHNVVSLTTTSGNYVAWGFASKNCDDELVQTARWRGCWRFSGAVVEHHHFMNRKAEMDETYQRGQEHFTDDRALFVERRKQWT